MHAQISVVIRLFFSSKKQSYNYCRILTFNNGVYYRTDSSGQAYHYY